MPIDRSEVKRIARLARLALDEAEVDRMAHELSSILAHFEALRGVDLEGVEPLAIAADRADPLRDDEPGTCDPLLDRPESLAPEWRDGFFLLPRLPALDAESLEAEEDPGATS
jgi:aspartyl-tRNA(Asn)/glutamyl-tRNA(Gln) amidotransferase subunit C